MSFKNTLLRKDFTINCKGKLLSLEKPVVMGIINVTDDSFYAASRSHTLHQVEEQAQQMLADGAQILDLGAQSTRPGSHVVGEKEELERLLPAIHSILHHHPDAILSIDTYYASVAKACVLAGAAIVNDISAGDMDQAMLSAVADLHVPYIAMHMQGTPQTMQADPQYDDVTKEVLDYCAQKLVACRAAGIKDVIIDPGFGFGKTIAHNYKLFHDLAEFQILETPLLVGISRKSMIHKFLGITPQEALNGTTVLNTIAIEKGAHILRVHDVKAAVEAIKMVTFMQTVK
ncbi:dihydropteroate synthase [Chitinophaga skermanii]|uniref:dihydropteroate synthase n=1 Tax=Chitinophaga skermanii TaxID=331697 RepID=A0A327QSW1_9BACT|nr:dihydropteroate synthase [Chitinophaga skermanii]RAJ06782.1 dihydropteroate synthase [Chitinophaga skermanii]